METMGSRPLDMLNKARNQRIIVELKNGKQMVGKLNAFDIHINVVLNDCEERVDGEVKRKLGTAFIRGDTIIMIASSE
jgi:small nuclear ribonucleoprotein (snRNP)-like protein